MKKLAHVFIALFLIFVLLFTASCNSDTMGSVVKCLGDVGFKVLASVPADAEPLTFASLLDAGPVCLDAAVAIFNSTPSNSSSNTPEVDINESSSEGNTTGSVTSNT